MRTAVRQAWVLTTLKVSSELEKLTNEKHTESATAKHHATANIVRSRPRAWVRLDHGSGCRGAEPYSARHSDRYYTTGGQFPFFGRARSGHSRVCLPAHRCGSVYGFLDGQGRSPRSNSVPDHLRADIPDHHAFPQHRYEPERSCSEPAAFWQRDVAEFA